MDAIVVSCAPGKARLLSVVNDEGLLFRFPHDLGTPELLQLGMQCSANGGRLCAAYASPAASHLAEALLLGAAGAAEHVECLGLTTLPDALRRLNGSATLAYVSCPLDDVTLLQISLWDAGGVALGGRELCELIEAGHFAQTPSIPRKAVARRSRASVNEGLFLVESPSHAVRCAVMKELGGRVLLATRENSLLDAPQKAVQCAGVDFGVWIDGEGTSLQVFDRAGRLVEAEEVVLAIVQHLGGASRVVLARNVSPSVAHRIRQMGMRITRSGATRREMALAMQKSGAALGGSPSGRIWFGDGAAIADAVFALNLLAAGGSCLLPQAIGAGRALSGLAA